MTNPKDTFPVDKLCVLYDLEYSFFQEMNEIGLIEFTIHDSELYIHQDTLYLVEKVIRIHRDLKINLAGIDVVMNMLRRQELLEEEVLHLKNKLKRYEDSY
ncbi:MAG: chaperone modulator CbpM [Muriicola sp.]|nr:chaperone modulator CbpM [Muriicola sp.]MBT8282968.1 chaperone modulator CbpM [Muriicola sp.]NNK09978.1 MerR family transcriptional regulator [Flavobacteriaceae bacterium]